jgi:hypothetical protein
LSNARITFLNIAIKQRLNAKSKADASNREGQISRTHLDAPGARRSIVSPPLPISRARRHRSLEAIAAGELLA